MPILNLQLSQAETGRIRLGMKVATGRGNGTRPTRLDRFRFTSPRKNLIEKIAELYGGKVEPWQPPRGAGQWEVVTNATDIPVVVPPQDPAESQWLELWSAGGCQRRCDGVTEKISGQACLCDPDPMLRDCKMHTRLRVMLEDVPGLGAWRVDTGSYYAATELPGIAQLLAQAQGAIPGRLVLDQRTVVRDGKTKNFVVPVLDCTELTPKELMSGKVQELMAARAAGAIEGKLRQAAALTAGPSRDYPSLIDAAKTREALLDLHKQAAKDFNDAVPQDLLNLFAARAEAIKQPQQSAPATPPAESGPATNSADLDELWVQILAESPTDSADELEQHFQQLVGHPSNDATVEETQRFLDAIRQAKAQKAAA
jgi:hypothetical protein